MECNGCGNKEAHRIKIYEDRTCVCDGCGMGTNATIHDVYWDGKPEHGLADDPVTGKPRVFGSKAEKAIYLKEKGLVEMGDRTNGAYSGVFKEGRKRDTRPEIRDVLARIKSMGREYRHEQYQRIMKNREKFHVER